MLEKCKTCPMKEGWVPVLQGTKLIIWLSQLHRTAWMHVFPELAYHEYALVPSPVDTGLFYDMKLKRSGVIAVNAGIDFKGRDNFIEWAKEHSDTQITLVGPCDKELPANVKRIGPVSYSEMNKLFNQHEIFVHLPVTPQPFERTMAEAYLAGCKIIGNASVGALSWGFEGKENLACLLEGASGDFWEELQSVL